MSANLPPLPRGRRMGSGVINGKLIELFMHDDAAMLAYATAALSAQATEVEALRADAERYRWLRVNPVHCANAADDQTYGSKKHRPEEFDAAVDAARAALKEQTPNVRANLPP